MGSQTDIECSHHLLTLVLDGKLYRAPLANDIHVCGPGLELYRSYVANLW